MQFRFLCVGRLKEPFFRAAVAEYQKRLGRFATTELIEIQDERAPERLSPGERAQVLEREGARLLEKISPQDFVVALCIEGKQLTSEGFAAALSGWMDGGHGRIAFLVGGSLGLSPAVRKRSDCQLSFSTMTFSHQIFRPMLLEQVYRACKIINHEPYHK